MILNKGADRTLLHLPLNVAIIQCFEYRFLNTRMLATVFIVFLLKNMFCFYRSECKCCTVYRCIVCIYFQTIFLYNMFICYCHQFMLIITIFNDKMSKGNSYLTSNSEMFDTRPSYYLNTIRNTYKQNADCIKALCEMTMRIVKFESICDSNLLKFMRPLVCE